MGLLLVFALSASWSIVHLWTYIRGHPLLAMLPFLFALLATGSWLTGALTDGVYMTNDFVAHGSREAVVAMIEAGELSPSPNRSYKWTPGLSDPYQLPPEYERLSKRGIVAVYEQEGARHVIFFAGRGMFESFSGYVYRADDGEPLLPERALHGPRFHRVKRLRDHWFLVGYYD